MAGSSSLLSFLHINIWYYIGFSNLNAQLDPYHIARLIKVYTDNYGTTKGHFLNQKTMAVIEKDTLDIACSIFFI